MGPWILGFSYEIFWRDRKRLRKRKLLFIHPWRRRGREEERARRQRRRAAIVKGFQIAEGEYLHGTHPKERAVVNPSVRPGSFIAGYG